MEDIERLKELIKPEHSCWIGITNQKAIENILEENNNLKAAALKNDDYYKEVCNKNKELEEALEIHKRGLEGILGEEK